tara:strand:- start:2915 stop:4036 length:1122 start_codon:yes stop_codon:yes gene_type:complete
MKIEKITIERNSPSDSDFRLLKLFVDNGDFVKKDTVIAEVEGAKAVFEIYSDFEGYFFTKFEVNDYIDLDETFFYITEKEVKDISLVEKEVNSFSSHQDSTDSLKKFSLPAIEYLKENNIDVEELIHKFKDYSVVTKEILILELTDKKMTLDPESVKSWKKKLKKLENKTPIYFIGGGYGALQVLDIAFKNKEYFIAGYFDDSSSALIDEIGIKNFGDASIENITSTCKKNGIEKICVTVSNNPKFRSKFIDLEESDISLVSFIHPNTVLGENVEIGDGTLIFANVHIGTDTSIGKLSFISSNSTIEHHNVIGNAFCCGPSFSTSGLVSIGNNTRVGINVGIEPSIKVGDNVVISSGSIVTSNIDSDKTLKHR